MAAGRRFLVVGLVVAAAEAALGVLLIGTILAPYFFGCAAAGTALAFVGRRLLEPPPEDEPPQGGGGGPPPPSPCPPWWPEFEADLRRYAAERERAPV